MANMIALPLEENSYVQPDWIYVRKFKKFLPPKKHLKFTVNPQPVEVRVEEINKLHFKKYLQDKFVKDILCDEAINNASMQSTIFLIYLHQIKRANSQEKNIEFASEVSYCSPLNITVLIKAPSQCMVREIVIRYLNNCYHNIKMMDMFEIEKSLTIWNLDKNKKYPSVEKGLRDMVAELKGSQLVSYEAKPNRLDVTTFNRSEQMCLNNAHEVKGNVFNDILSYFGFPVKGKKLKLEKLGRRVHDISRVSKKSFMVLEDKKLKIEEDISVKESFESNDNGKNSECTVLICGIHAGTDCTVPMHNSNPGTDCIVPIHSSHPDTDLINLNELTNTCYDKYYADEVLSNNDGLNETTNFKTKYIDSNKLPVPCKAEALVTKNWTGNDSINEKKNVTTKNAKKNVKTGNETKNVNTENETKIEKTENETKLVETKNDLLIRNGEKATDQPIVHKESIFIHKKQSNCNSSVVATPTQARKVVLYEPFKEVSLCGFKEKLYGNENIIDGKPETKTLLLFGEKGSGKSSLINFIGDTFWGNGNSSKKNVIDTSENTNAITFYTFKSSDANRADLTIIDTPGLSSLDMKKFLSSEEVNVVIHSLGFVVNSQSQGLTANEKKMLDYIRSAYGEVSNNHLITFLTFSDVTKTRPVIEDLKRYGVKPTCILEFNLIPVKDKTFDDFDNIFWKKNVKKWKTGLKAINQMDPVSNKSMKLAQEATYIKTFCEASIVNLKNEIMSLLSAEETNGKEIAQNVWELGRLAFALQEETDYSDAKLIQFLATVFAEVCKMENLQKSNFIFTFLLMVNSDNHLTTSVIPVLNFYNDVFLRFPAFLKNKETPIYVATLSDKDEVTVFCKQCKDIHCGFRVLEEQDNPYNFVIRCRNCSCHGNAHELWTLKNSYDLVQELRLVVNDSLQPIVKDLSALGLSLEISLPEFLEVIVSIYPVYADLIRVLQN